MNHPQVRQKDGDKAFGRILGAVIAIMLIPFITMLFIGEMRWTVFDFAMVGMIALGVGTIFIVASRRVTKSSHRAAIAFTCVALLLYVWAELAVGVFTNLGN